MPEIHLKGHLYRYDPQRRRVLRIDCAYPKKLSELLQELNLPEYEVYLVLVNGQRADDGTLVKNEDLVVLIPPVAGG